MNDKMNP